MDLSKIKVLVIDDQSFVRHIVVTMLKHLGVHDVREAAEGGDGLKCAGEYHPDLILCDIEMKPIDGLVFLDALRKSKTGRRDIPVVFLTCHSESSVVKKAKELGVDDFLVKPVSANMLEKCLHRVWSHKMQGLKAPPAAATPESPSH